MRHDNSGRPLQRCPRLAEPTCREQSLFRHWFPGIHQHNISLPRNEAVLKSVIEHNHIAVRMRLHVPADRRTSIGLSENRNTRQQPHVLRSLI